MQECTWPSEITAGGQGAGEREGKENESRQGQTAEPKSIGSANLSKSLAFSLLETIGGMGAW